MSEAGRTNRRVAADDEGDEGRGRGVVIAHPSPSIRVRLALALLDARPVVLASGAEGIARLARRHGVRAPCAIVLDAAQLRSLRGAAMRACAGAKLVVIDGPCEDVECDLRLESLVIARVVELLDAA